MVDQGRSTQEPAHIYQDAMEHHDTDTRSVAPGLDKTTRLVGYAVMRANALRIADSHVRVNLLHV